MQYGGYVITAIAFFLLGLLFGAIFFGDEADAAEAFSYVTNVVASRGWCHPLSRCG